MNDEDARCSLQHENSALSKFHKETSLMGLVVNGNKTKFVEVLADFIYQRNSMNIKEIFSLEIQHKVTLVNSWYFELFMNKDQALSAAQDARST